MRIKLTDEEMFRAIMSKHVMLSNDLGGEITDSDKLVQSPDPIELLTRRLDGKAIKRYVSNTPRSGRKQFDPKSCVSSYLVKSAYKDLFIRRTFIYSLSDNKLIKELGISRMTFYKYKKGILAELEKQLKEDSMETQTTGKSLGEIEEEIDKKAEEVVVTDRVPAWILEDIQKR